MPTVFNEGRHPGEFLLSEGAGQISREAGTVASGSGIIAPGTVLGRLTAGGKLVPSPATGADGSQTAMAVALHGCDATGADQVLAIIARDAEVTAAVGAANYVIHSGIVPMQQSQGIEDAYLRQREWLARGGDLAAECGITLCVETLFTDDHNRHTATPARLARELAAIAHPAVMATIDISHAYLRLDYDGRRNDLIEELAALARFGKHLHIHDSFGRQDDIWMFTEGERLAFGHGDLHLPVGWGDIPWPGIMAACELPPGAVFNIELKDRYWYAAQDCVDAVKALAVTARTAELELEHAVA
jgi:sugar phosphate isomerase/epimerase